MTAQTTVSKFSTVHELFLCRVLACLLCTVHAAKATNIQKVNKFTRALHNQIIKIKDTTKKIIKHEMPSTASPPTGGEMIAHALRDG